MDSHSPTADAADSTATSQTPSSSPLPAPLLPPQGEGCPAPLAWADVVTTYLQESCERTAEFDGGTISCRTIGKGPPLYFLGGASGDGRLFALTAWLLREERECVIVEYPQFERRPSSRTYVSQCVDALERLRGTLGHAHVDVFGAMFGGLVSLEWLREAPQSVTRGILQTPTLAIPWTLFERGLLSVGRSLPFEVASLPGWKPLQERNHRAWFPPFDETRWGFLLENLSRTPIRDLAVRMRATGAAISPAIESIRQPVLIVRTEGEGAGHTRRAEQLESLLLSARTEWMHTAGHLPFLTHPHRLVKVIRSFLGEALQ